MVTIKDVAAKAGVNPSTVSRVLKDNPSISQKTKDKVRLAMADLGYVPNIAAQTLSSGLTHSVGLVFPPLVTPDRVNDPFFMRMLTTITNVARVEGFTVSIASGMTVEALADQVQLMHRQKRVDGFIVLYSQTNDLVQTYLLENNIPFVVVGSTEGFDTHITSIDNDNQLMGRTAVDYLYQNGHKNIGFVTDDMNSKVFKERFLGYQKGMEALSLSSKAPLLFDRKDGLVLDQMIATLTEQKPTALIVIGDTVSLRIIQLLSYYQIKVPDDISVITFNNSAYAELVHPYLTTFDVNIDSLGRNSFRYLVDRIQSNGKENEKIVVPFALEERESVRSI